jgi:CheY-like chemotaxis protein
MSKHYQRPAIIIVEDAPDMRILVQRLIHGLTTDFDLIAVDRAAKALGHLEHRVVPLLITDYAMPEMDGLQLTRAVKAVSPATTVLLITAHSSSEMRAQAQAAGADYFLAKPFPLSQLDELVHTVTRRWRAANPPPTAND